MSRKSDTPKNQAVLSIISGGGKKPAAWEVSTDEIAEALTEICADNMKDPIGGVIVWREADGRYRCRYGGDAMLFLDGYSEYLSKVAETRDKTPNLQLIQGGAA